MNRAQATLAGIGIGFSGLLLSVGAALIAESARDPFDVADQDDEVQVAELGETARTAPAVDRAALYAPLAPRDGSSERLAFHAVDAQTQAARPPRAALRRGLDYSVSTTSDDVSPELADVREAVLTGDQEKVTQAIAVHNAKGGTRVLLHDDPELEKLGVGVTARWDRAAQFGVVLEANASSDSKEPLTVLVAPGAIVKASPGYQDTAPIQARFLKVEPRGHAEGRATICCAMIHSNDPRAESPRGIGRHQDPRVARVAAAAERTGAGWGTAQVALWAVANDATRNDVRSAPGGYSCYIDGARDLLEKAGIDTNRLALYAHAAPRERERALGGELGRDLLEALQGG